MIQVWSTVAFTLLFQKTFKQRYCLLTAFTAFHQTVFEQMAEDALAVLEYTEQSSSFHPQTQDSQLRSIKHNQTLLFSVDPHAGSY